MIPSIDVEISVSSPVLDLSSTENLIITISLTLNHSGPVTFCRHDCNLLNGSVMAKGGLAFIDIDTGNKAGRGELDICRARYPDCPRSLNDYTTLHPAQKHNITTGIVRQEGGDDESGFVIEKQYWRGELSAEELIEKLGEIPRVWRWWNSECLEDGKVYKIGVEEEGITTGWVPWDKEQFRTIPIPEIERAVRKEMIPFRITKTAQFLVKRPDTDGSLNFP